MMWFNKQRLDEMDDVTLCFFQVPIGVRQHSTHSKRLQANGDSVLVFIGRILGS